MAHSFRSATCGERARAATVPTNRTWRPRPHYLLAPRTRASRRYPGKQSSFFDRKIEARPLEPQGCLQGPWRKVFLSQSPSSRQSSSPPASRRPLRKTYGHVGLDKQNTLGARKKSASPPQIPWGRLLKRTSSTRGKEGGEWREWEIISSPPLAQGHAPLGKILRTYTTLLLREVIYGALRILVPVCGACNFFLHPLYEDCCSQPERPRTIYEKTSC